MLVGCCSAVLMRHESVMTMVVMMVVMKGWRRRGRHRVLVPLDVRLVVYSHGRGAVQAAVVDRSGVDAPLWISAPVVDSAVVNGTASGLEAVGNRRAASATSASSAAPASLCDADGTS